MDRGSATALIGIRTANKEEFESSVAHLVYGEPLRVPSDLLVPATAKLEASTFIQQLRRRMEQLRPIHTVRHASPATYSYKELQDSTHVFLRQDPARRAMEPPYSVLHKVRACTDKRLTIVVRGRQVNVSADRIKPAYVLEVTQHETEGPPAQPSPTAIQRNLLRRLGLNRLLAQDALYASQLGLPAKF